MFYCRQSKLEVEGNDWRGHSAGGLYLQFGQIGTSKFGDVGLETTEVGKMVCEALKSVGLKFEWDGSPMTCIWVEAG